MDEKLIKRQHYRLDIVMKKYKKNELWPSLINDDEYCLFCRAMRILPIEVFDTIHSDKMSKKIYFVLMGSKNNKVGDSCIIWFEKLEVANSRAMIIYSPVVFVLEDRRQAIKIMLHEIGHYYLEINDDRSPDIERAADELADTWIRSFECHTGEVVGSSDR